jgi:hypothetical protein
MPRSSAHRPRCLDSLLVFLRRASCRLRRRPSISQEVDTYLLEQLIVPALRDLAGPIDPTSRERAKQHMLATFREVRCRMDHAQGEGREPGV